MAAHRRAPSVGSRETALKESTMAFTAVPPSAAEVPSGRRSPPVARTRDPWRHAAWLAGGMVGAFLVPFVVAGQLGVQRDVYLIVYAAAVVGLFAGWAHDTGESVGDMCSRRWRLALALAVVFAGVGALIAVNAEAGSVG